VIKSIRVSDGLVVDLPFIYEHPGDYVNYWGPKELGEYDVPPRGDQWGHFIEPEAVVAPAGPRKAPAVTLGCR
jgi:hypothetical protein